MGFTPIYALCGLAVLHRLLHLLIFNFSVLHIAILPQSSCLFQLFHLVDNTDNLSVRSPPANHYPSCLLHTQLSTVPLSKSSTHSRSCTPLFFAPLMHLPRADHPYYVLPSFHPSSTTAFHSLAISQCLHPWPLHRAVHRSEPARTSVLRPNLSTTLLLFVDNSCRHSRANSAVIIRPNRDLLFSQLLCYYGRPGLRADIHLA